MRHMGGRANEKELLWRGRDARCPIGRRLACSGGQELGDPGGNGALRVIEIEGRRNF